MNALRYWKVIVLTKHTASYLLNYYWQGTVVYVGWGLQYSEQKGILQVYFNCSQWYQFQCDVSIQNGIYIYI